MLQYIYAIGDQMLHCIWINVRISHFFISVVDVCQLTAKHVVPLVWN